MFDLLAILFLDAYSKTDLKQRVRLSHIERRKQEYQRFRNNVKQAQLKRAEKMILLNDIHRYKHGSDFFDPDLKRMRKLLGNKGCNAILDRIEEVQQTNFDTIKYM